MRGLILGLISSMMILFVVWTAVAYDKYGADLIYHHLDLQAMFLRFKDNWIGYDVFDALKGLKNMTSFFGNVTLSKNILKAITSTVGFLTSNPNLYNNLLNNNEFFSFIVNALAILIEPFWAITYSIAIIGYFTYSCILMAFDSLGIIIECLGFVFNPIFI